VRRADKLTTFMCRLSRYLGASTSWNPKRMSRPVMGLLYLYMEAVSSAFERLVSAGQTTRHHNHEYHNLNTHFHENITLHVAVRSLRNSLYPAGRAATLVVPKVTESIKSGVYGFGILKIGSSRSFGPVDSHTRISLVVKGTHTLPNTS
jgi:hypothetical protein